MIILDYKDRRPIYEQVIGKFQDLIACDVLKEDSQLPSVRNLAMDLSINPNTIQRAYSELERRGFIYSIKGKGSFVVENSNMKAAKQKRIYDDLQKLTKEAKVMGVTKKELLETIDEIYDERGDER